MPGIYFCFVVTSGDYGEAGTVQFLKDFHRRRLQVLAEAGPDLIAFETIPNKLEAQVLFCYLNRLTSIFYTDLCECL